MSREELEGLFSTAGEPPVHQDYTGGIRDGLFVAKEIMEAAGGQLWAESAEGKGTRFNLRIPTS
jgi:signal transduction histidine kinase